ncbi:group-specific protein [Lysinibacillus sp. HST-98]|uniref:hypothetical protein n=1 Tax=Lysinibacillus TaxID=400634 RepID=UPI0001DA5A3B|nr:MULTISPECIES: hypothetical protein [Lysinibacillus]EFI68642.1 group-specific protein [Lysinibacillus fusiformis ZC1]EKU43557.1 group-specific protein [Lysinibacillus fusiformis ZB2]MBL3730027.1 group-specific protein [Lysinibacillus sp. HST-98]MBU5252462.1 group-specific protein [Lysinibacillus capsici]MED4699793.1 group-specific protein [Lysinibacillus capsici]
MFDLNNAKNNQLNLEVTAPYSLNYLIFIQNLFLNNSSNNNPQSPFPNFNSSGWGILPQEKFNIKFKEIWNEVINNTVQNQYYDSNGVLENESTFYRQLFDRNENGEFGFSESVKLFLSWWNGFHGKIAIEKLFESVGGQVIYNELSQSQILYDLNIKQFKINIIYDKQRLFPTTSSLSFAVLPIQELFLNSTDIVSNLLGIEENSN